uniref:Uncharacterized protein n=1 Tax=Meloidogyne floridensis TaxID=298350 RepID=A0A915NW47_9BILA
MRDYSKIKTNKNKLNEDEIEEYNIWQKIELARNLKIINEGKGIFDEDYVLNTITERTKKFCDQHGLSIIKVDEENNNDEVDIIAKNLENKIGKNIEDIENNQEENNCEDFDENVVEKSGQLCENIVDNEIFFKKLIYEDEILAKHYKDALFNESFPIKRLPDMYAANFISF